MVFVYQGETHQLSICIHHQVVSFTEFVSVFKPIAIDCFTHESTGTPPQTLVEEFIGAKDGKVVH
jgi:hypothetical protein